MMAMKNDNPGLEAKIAALMEKNEKKKNNEKNPEKIDKDDKTDKDASITTYEDYCRVEKLDEWPYRLTSEGPLGIDENAMGFGTKDDIVNIIKEAAPLDLEALDSLENKLTTLERILKSYADKLVTDEHRESPSELQKWLHSPRKSVDESEGAKSHGGKAVRKNTFSESVAEMRKRSLDFCSFPGFRKGELTELPSQLESPQILHRVTKTQDFNPGFKKFWQKIFLSEASVAIMQDFFWWFFLDNYETNRKDEQTLLFDRIADSFCALFNSINPEIKDKFFQVYDNCLAQAIFAAYYEAFSESQKQFDDDFKAKLINTTSQWISGVRPAPRVYKSWNIKRLTRKSLKPGDDTKNNMSKMVSALSQDGVKIDLDIDSFEKMVNKLGDTGPGVTNSRQNTADLGSTRPVTVSGPAALPSQSIQPLNVSRQAQCGSPRKVGKESHQAGPGPKFERVLFDTLGRSPLIAHYLHRRQLQDIKRPELKVKRTEVVSVQQDAPTYRDLINNRMAMSQTLSKEYQRICDQTNQEILRIERKKIDTNREIDALQKEILFNRNPVDLKIMSEKILEMRERNTPTAGINVGDLRIQCDDSSEDSD
ncbi:protein FAM227B-like [Lineus longissimus]|uniref:protein FAM227B-like n=1 Tax=Lineus longissimus TaxID=88925 RepID=UPI002B4E1475